MKKLLLGFVVLSTVIFSSCAGLLGSEPRGGQASEEQVRGSYKALEAQLNGIYEYMTNGGGVLGQQKRFDVSTDFLTSDYVVTNTIYGWSYYYVSQIYESYLPSSSLNNFVWSTEYYLIRNINMLLMESKAMLESGETHGVSEDRIKNIIGQAYALRGQAYANLLNLYTNPAQVDADKLIIPYYSDDSVSMTEPQKFQSYKTVYKAVESDLLRAIEFLKDSERPTSDKTSVDANIARVILANVYLNDGRVFQPANQTENVGKALALLETVIENSKGKYSVLPYDQVLTNGFNSIKSPNWIWGVDVDIESSLGINTFFSWVDIYSYGYASYTDNIALDDSIYTHFDNMLSANDIRKQWFITPDDPTLLPDGKNTYGESHGLAPYKKFFNAERKWGADKTWLNDLVFMRIEEVYILAAEAALVSGDEAKAIKYLKEVVQERDPDYVATLETLSGDALNKYLINNLRIELWLEGKSFMAWKRFQWTHTRGQTHLEHRGKEVKPTDTGWYVLELNATERTYNPNTPRD